MVYIWGYGSVVYVCMYGMSLYMSVWHVIYIQGCGIGSICGGVVCAINIYGIYVRIV